ncbi:MAG TPA: hypothetical protein V6D07_11620 [Trichocoleus sp.]
MQNCQPTATPAPPPSQPPASMTQVVVEETIMAVAKWLVNLVSRTLETKTAPQPAEQEPLADPAPVGSSEVNTANVNGHPAQSGQVSTVDQLLAKFSCLIEESCDRSQAIALLENRLQGIESALQANQSWEESIQLLSQAVVKLDSRLSQVEQVLAQVDLDKISNILAASSGNEAQLQQWIQASKDQTTALNSRLATLETAVKIAEDRHHSALDQISGTVQPAIQQATALEGRISYLEKMIARLSLVPKFVESNYRSIASIQSRMKQLKDVPAANGNGSQK